MAGALFALTIITFTTLAYSDVLSPSTPSTTTPVPPLQWINLTHLLSASNGPPPLKDATIGYYDALRTLAIFAGESSDGIAQSTTFLLNLDNLTWSTPNPLPIEDIIPGARSSALYGDDSSSSYRNALVIVGGKGTDGQPLSDVWEFDYVSQAWGEVIMSPGGPSPRWGASGGTLSNTPANFTDSIYGNTTIYLAGGFDGSNILSLSDVWELSVTGVLSSNNRNDTFGSWKHIPAQTALPSLVNQAAAILPSASIVSVGGCNVSDSDDVSCAVQDAVVIQVGGSDSQPTGCVPPRFGGALVPNRNQYSDTFANQAFLILGLFNESLWDDSGALAKGEVDVLNTQTGVWSRILPSGDPGTSGGTPSFPSPRQGSAAYAFPSALVGSSRSSASDTIVFGGQDSDGNYLNELWILRAYNDILTTTNQTWEPTGTETTGLDASGAGVTIQYLTECAKQLKVVSSSKPTSSVSSTTSTQTGLSTTSTHPSSFDTSIIHKVLSPVSTLLILATVFASRLTYPTSGRVLTLLASWLALPTGIAAYAIGLAGLAASFTSSKRITSTTSSLSKRTTADGVLLQTAHGRAGLALFVVVYGLLIVSFIIRLVHMRHAHDAQRSLTAASSPSLGEKADPATPSAPASPIPRPTSPRKDSNRVSQTGSASMLLRPTRGRTSLESHSGDESRNSVPTSRTFEVVNRPSRHRRASDSIASHDFAPQRSITTSRNLSDINWLERRRSVNAVGELDYVLTQLENESRRAAREEVSSANPLLDTMAATASLPSVVESPETPSFVEGILHVVVHLTLLALCGLCLAELWLRAPRATFVVFLILTLAFYLAMFSLAWYGRPRRSLLVVSISRLRGDKTEKAYNEATGPRTPSMTPVSALAVSPDTMRSPESRSPYTHHQPPYRSVPGNVVEDDVTSQGLRSFDGDDDEGEEDEDTQQRRMEAEMDRRNVSIITVPKAKLWIANP